MTRTDRLIAIVCFVAAFLVLFLLASFAGNLGPVEFIVVLVLAIPAGMLIGRIVRMIARVPRRST